MVPFFSIENGIFWEGHTTDAWKRLGYNIAGAISIIAWSALWSCLMFGSLKYFNLLRIDRDTEFRGNDIVKHGEPAYPVDAWVELQYERKKDARAGKAAPHMQSSAERGKDNKAYNDAFEMVPTTGKLFRELGKTGFLGDGGGGSSNNADEVDNKNTQNA